MYNLIPKKMVENEQKIFKNKNLFKNNNNILLKIKQINIKNNHKNTHFRDSRIYYFDILRIISSFAVVLIHVSARYNRFDINSHNWKISFYYNGMSRFAVPLFFMMSGALFLNKNIPLKKIFNKYIKNIIIHLLFWSFIYSIYILDISKKNIPKIIIKLFSGNYHFWYLYTTIELYICVPFLSFYASVIIL